MNRTYYVYILTDHRNGVFYTGVTNDILRRCQEHRDLKSSKFTRKHAIRHLVWYEPHDDIERAIWREKRIKRWPRAYKFNVIEELNPEWRDLYFSLTGSEIDDCPKIPDPRINRG